MVERSDAAILEGARLHVSQPHGWGISMSKSGEFQMSVNNASGHIRNLYVYQAKSPGQRLASCKHTCKYQVYALAMSPRRNNRKSKELTIRTPMIRP